MIPRTLRAIAATAAATVALGMVGTTAAQAKPTQPGSVTGLVVDSVTPSGSTYAVASHWNPVASATKYRVAVTKSGATLVSATVTTASWSGTLATTPGDATLAVRAVIARKPGPAATVVVHLPDVTAPTGTFTTAWVNSTKVATLTEASLSDNSPISQVTRSVDWGDGTVVSWPAGVGFPNDSLQHTYTTVDRFVPVVTLTDAANNSVSVNAPAVVIDDVTAPSGTFTVSPVSAWATFTRVTVTQTALSDDRSPATALARVIDWGDGTAPESWPAGTGFPGDALTHTYAQAGTYEVTQTLTDEAHNVFVSPPTAVTVKADTVAPVVRLLIPRAKHSVKAWTTLRGKATDTNGTGVKVVSLRAVEKRGTVWYGYQATTKRWVKAATMAKAFARSRAFALHTSATNAWAGKLAGLRKGTLVYKVKATDNVGNVSGIVTHKASLTRR